MDSMTWRRTAFVLLVLGAMIMAVSLAMRMLVTPHVYTVAQDVPSAQYVVILGASVVHGEPSALLAQRIDAALALYRAHRAERILITGDNGDRNYDEVSVILDYLRARDIPESDIFLDRAGFDTYSSMYRAQHVLGVHSAVITTQDFHIPRALFLARSLGIEADGFVAGSGGRIRDYVREIPASLKALVDIVTRRSPEHIDEPIIPAKESVQS